MEIKLDAPTKVIKQPEVSETVSVINVQRLVLNFNLRQARAFTDGGGPIVIASDTAFDTLIASGSLDLKTLGEIIKTKVLSGETGRANVAPGRAAAAGRP